MAKIKWTKEALAKSASRHETLKEWRLSEPSAYATASRLKLLPELTIGMEKKIEHGFWTEAVVTERAKQFTNKRDWIKSDYKSYTAAQRLGIVDKVSVHMEPLGNRHKRCLYSIEIIGQNMIYIGLTYDFSRRMRDHMKSRRFIDLIDRYGEGCIEKVQLTDYIDKKEAAEKEGLLVEQFAKQGYQILNIQKTGSLGGNIIKWTKEAIFEDANKYSSVMDWAKAPQSGYAAASAMGILSKCTSHMERLIKEPGSYTKEDIIKASTQFTQIIEWNKKDRKTYAAARRMNLLEDPDVIGHFTKGEVINKKWVKERVLEAVKDFRSVSEWKSKSPGSYKAARADGYFEEIKSKMNPPAREAKWNLESIAADAKKYSTKSEWKKHSGGAYVAAQKLRIIDDVCGHMTVLNLKGRWSSDEAIITEARKYNSKSEWQKHSVGSYEAAKKKGVFELAVAHMTRPVMTMKWTEAAIRKDAKRYSSKSEWARKSFGAYEAAKKKGIFTEVTSHMQKPPQKLKWDDASIATDALKYESKSQWKRNSIGAYTAAKKRGIFDSVTSHM